MKNRVAIFARVSTDQQSYDRQLSDLKSYAESRGLEVVSIITEKVSGAKNNSDREGIIELLNQGRAGKFNKILLTELSRLGRDAFQVSTLINEFSELGISIVIQTLGIETLAENGKPNPMVDLLIAVINQFSQMERAFLIDRITSGLAKAKENGKTLGRPQGTTLEDNELLKKYGGLVRDLKSNISVRKAAKIHQISTATVQKVKKVMNLAA